MAKKLKLEIFPVENAADALERTKIELPVFVLLDVSMPMMSGIDCGREIKSFSHSINTILISTINSLSLQDAAKQAEVDLFVVDSVSSVKVPEFVEAVLLKKELPRDISEEIEREVLSKRGTQRFPFEGEVQYQIGDKWHSGIFVNLSQDGLLFQSNVEVGHGTKLLLSWMDQGTKHIEVSAIVVRQLGSSNSQYAYLIGVQFLKASRALDQKIEQLSEQVDYFQESTAIELELDLIQELLSTRGSYFSDMFRGEKAPLFVELSINDIVEHERQSFQQNDEYSLCIQELVTSKILCQMMESAIVQLKNLKVPPKTYATRILTLISQLLEKIEHTENNSDSLVKKSIQEGRVTERHQLNESNNRLYQAKASVLDVFCKKISRNDIPPTHHAGFENIIEQNKQITSYQEHLNELAAEEVRERKKLLETRITMPVERSVVGTESPSVKMARNVAQQKTNVIFPFAAFLLIMVAIIPRIEELLKVHFSHDEVALAIKPKYVDRKSHESLVIGIGKNDWDQLGDRGRDLILDQIEVYLTQKKLHQCKILDGDQLIAAVYGTISNEHPAYLRNVFFDKPVPAAQVISKIPKPESKTYVAPVEKTRSNKKNHKKK